jgi:hypothetical protein
MRGFGEINGEEMNTYINPFPLQNYINHETHTGTAEVLPTQYKITLRQSWHFTSGKYMYHIF